jgi:alpha-ketoglutarate-dependent taurine dioxygenase
LLGRPVAQKWNGSMVYDVRDVGNTVQQGVRGSTTSGQLFFHTDNSYAMMPPQYVGLLCLQKSKEGGQSRLVSWGSVYSEMRRRYPELIPRGFRAFLWDRVNEHAPDAPRIMSKPVFFHTDGRLRVCYSSRVIKDGYRMAGQTVDDETVRFLDAMDAILDDPSFWADLQFERGQIQIINNGRIGHSRTAFIDHADPEQKRHLIRLWFREHGRMSYDG